MRARRLLSVGYRHLLRLFPRRYRADYQAELEQVVDQLVAAEARRGAWPLVRLVGRELRDLPAALLRAHWREWRRRAVNANPMATPSEEPVAGRRWLAVFAPFLAAGLFVATTWLPLGTSIVVVAHSLALLGMLAYVLAALVAGVARGAPRWAFPGLGLDLAILAFLFMATSDSFLPFLDVRLIPWTSSRWVRIVSQTVQNLYRYLPVLLLCAALAVLSVWVVPLRAALQRVRRDWTLLSFLFYGLTFLPVLLQDEYAGLAPYQLASLAALAAGAWAYLRLRGSGQRLIVLLAGVELAMAILALGIYTLYPHQEWAARTSFPRWWEGIAPLMEGVALGILLILPAVLKLLPAVTPGPRAAHA